MGIHNEAGIAKVKLSSSKELIANMLKLVLDTSDEDRAFVDFKHDGKDEVVLLVNNLYGRFVASGIVFELTLPPSLQWWRL